jgi:hypothetical protein
MPEPRVKPLSAEELSQWETKYYEARHTLISHMKNMNSLSQLPPDLKNPEPSSSKNEKTATGIIKKATMEASVDRNKSCLATLKALEEERDGLYKKLEPMPKGGLLHTHYNMTFRGDLLIKHAKDVPCMYIQSDLPLTSTYNMQMCRIQFNPMSDDHFRTAKQKKKLFDGNLFSAQYGGVGYWMRYSEFLKEFRQPGVSIDGRDRQKEAEDWLAEKGKFEIDEIESKKHYYPNLDHEDPCQ